MKMKKVLAAVLAGTMVMASVVAVSAETVTESKTYDGGQTIDGSSGWNTADGDNYLISTTPVTVVFENTPFVRDTDNWSQFVFETVSSESADGITLRADAYGWTYTYEEDVAVNTPTYAVETSWGDTWDDFATYSAEDITIVATQTDDSTVTFAISFGSLATETYTVTYPDGVPSELYFHVGADGGSISVLSVTYGSDDSSSNDSSSDDDSSDDNSDADSSSDSSDDSTSDSSDDKNTGTGDAAPIAATVVALLGCAAIVVASKKRMA